MATIRAAIALYDGVTAPLMHMNRALHVVLNSFEAMQAAGAHPVDTAAIRQAREELARAETAFDSIEEAIRRGERRQRGFNQSVRDGTQAAGGLLSRVRQIGAAVGGAIAVRRLVGISDTLTGTTARLNLIVWRSWNRKSWLRRCAPVPRILIRRRWSLKWGSTLARRLKAMMN